jgi:hypothetical protein
MTQSSADRLSNGMHCLINEISKRNIYIDSALSTSIEEHSQIGHRSSHHVNDDQCLLNVIDMSIFLIEIECQSFLDVHQYRNDDGRVPCFQLSFDLSVQRSSTTIISPLTYQIRIVVQH